MDDQEKYQLKKIYQTMQTEGWAFLMAAMSQKREQVIAKLKRAGSESSWRNQQGRLDGFDEAVNLPDVLVRGLDDDADEKTAAQLADETLQTLTGGNK